MADMATFAPQGQHPAEEGRVALKNKVLQHAKHGLELTLTPQDLAGAIRASKELYEPLFRTTRQPVSQTPCSFGLSVGSQNSPALYALFSLALRQSAPVWTDEGSRSAYAVICRVLCRKLSIFAIDNKVSCGVPLSQALLGTDAQTDALRCYSRLFREAADLLQQEVALYFLSQPENTRSAAPPGGEPRQVAATSATTGLSAGSSSRGCSWERGAENSSTGSSGEQQQRARAGSRS